MEYWTYHDLSKALRNESAYGSKVRCHVSSLCSYRIQTEGIAISIEGLKVCCRQIEMTRRTKDEAR